MPDEEGPRIIADDDWKAQAQREKERLAAEAEKEKAAKAAEGGEARESLFLELLDSLFQQAIIALGGAQTQDGRTIPPSPALAKHLIDMIGMLEEKTKGNLTKEESEILNNGLSRLRWAFGMALAPAPGTAGAEKSGGAKPPPTAEKGPKSS